MPARRVFFFVRGVLFVSGAFAALLARHVALALRSLAGAAPLDGIAFHPR
jgi:hypothetical protein